MLDSNNLLIVKMKYLCMFNVMILDIMYVYFVFFFYVEIVDIGESLDVLRNIRSKYGVRY